MRLRKLTWEQVDLDSRTIKTWYSIKVTSPLELKGAFLSINGVWRWETSLGRDLALVDARARIKYPPSGVPEMPRP